MHAVAGLVGFAAGLAAAAAVAVAGSEIHEAYS
jgi:hypothetical protein